MNSQITRIFLCALLIIQILLVNISCISTGKIAYFYNVKDTTFLQRTPDYQNTIQQNDILGIAISLSLIHI